MGKKKILIFLVSLFIHVDAHAQVREIELKPSYVLGSEEENAPPELAFYWTISADVDSQGNIYILDSGNQRVLKFDKDYNFLLEFGRWGKGPGEFNFRPYMLNTGALAVNERGEIYVVDNGNARVQIFDATGKYLKGFRIPWTANDIDVDNQGRIYLFTRSGQRDDLIYVFNQKGEFETSFVKKVIKTKRFWSLNSIEFSVNKRGEIYVGFKYWPIIRKYDRNRRLIFEKDLSKFKEVKRCLKGSKNKSFDYLKKFPLKDTMKGWTEVIRGIYGVEEGCYIAIPTGIIFLDAQRKVNHILRPYVDYRIRERKVLLIPYTFDFIIKRKQQTLLLLTESKLLIYKY